MSYTLEAIVIESMAPNMEDYMDDYAIVPSPVYWDLYCDMLEELELNKQWLTMLCNNIFLNYSSNNGRYNACVDVASTLESLAPEKYAGKFKY